MAIVNSTLAALSSGDRYNLVCHPFGWEIQDNREHRVVDIFHEEAPARQAYAKLTEGQQQ
jgi:hypothetical protein